MDQPTTPAQATDQLQQAAASAPPTGASTPDAQAGASTPAAGAPNTPTQPQQPQDASQGGPQDSSNPEASQSAADAKTDLSKPATGTPAASATNPAVHPAVQKAGVIRDIAQTLAGGPRTSYAIDPNTGEMKETKVPLSGKQIGLAIAMAALTGGIQGLGEKGPGAEGRAAAAGFNTVQAQQQQQKQQQQQQASQNYARAAAIANTNFQTHQNALRLSQMEYDYHNQFVKTGEPVLSNIKSVGAALESGVHESDLTTKYHVTKDMAIPDGIVENGKNPDGSTHWENTYTVIDPNKKIELPKETAQLLSDLRVPGYFTTDKDGKTAPINFTGSAPIKAGLVVNGLAMAQSFQITEGQLNRQFASLKDGDKDTSVFDANLKKAIASGDMTIKGLQTIGNYANMPLDQAVAAMEKNKVDPAIIQQYQKLVPQDAIDQMKVKRASDAAAQKATDARTNLVVSKTNFDEVLANPKAYSPDQVAAAQNVDKQVRNEKSRDAYTEGAEHRQAELNVDKANGVPLPGSKTNSKSDAEENLTHPELASLVQDQGNYNTPNGTNQKFLAGLMKIDPERAKMIQAYSKGMDIQSYYAAVKQFGGSINADIHAYDPSFNASSMRRYDKTMQEWGASGKLGRTNAAASTALEHLGSLYDSYGVGSATGMSGDYDTSLNQGSTEIASMYANGNKPGEDEIKHTREALDHPQNIYKGKQATVKTAREAMDKIEENYNQYDKDLPGGIQREPPLSVKAAKAYKHITGDDVDPKFVNQNLQTRIGPDGQRVQGSTQPSNPTTPQGATGTAKAADGKTYYHDAKGNNLGPVPQ